MQASCPSFPAATAKLTPYDRQKTHSLSLSLLLSPSLSFSLVLSLSLSFSLLLSPSLSSSLSYRCNSSIYCIIEGCRPPSSERHAVEWNRDMCCELEWRQWRQVCLLGNGFRSPSPPRCFSWYIVNSCNHTTKEGRQKNLVATSPSPIIKCENLLWQSR